MYVCNYILLPVWKYSPVIPSLMHEVKNLYQYIWVYFYHTIGLFPAVTLTA